MSSQKLSRKTPLATVGATTTISAAPIKCTTDLAQRSLLAVVQFVEPKPAKSFADLYSKEVIVLEEMRVWHSLKVQRSRILEDLSQRGVLIPVQQAEPHDGEPPIFQVDLFMVGLVDVFHLFYLFDLLEDYATKFVMGESE